MAERDIKELHALENKARVIGHAIAEELKGKCGFALFLFDFGEDGWFTYLSNAAREDMIKLLREQLANFEQEAPSGHAPDGEA